MSKKYFAGHLTGADFKAIRTGLLLTQLELANLLGYRHKIRVSEYERPTNPVPIPVHIQEAMVALYESGGLTTRRNRAVRGWSRAA